MNPQMLMTLLPFALSAVGGLTGDKAKQGSTYQKNQRSTIDSLLESVNQMRGGGGQDITQNPTYQGGNEFLQSLYNDPSFFQKFEAPLQRQFEEQTLPDIANRFGSMGSGGATGSSAFRNAANRAGVDFQTNLAGLRGGMQQQGAGQSLQYAQQPFSNIMSMLQQALQPTQNQYHPATPGFGGNIGSSMFGGLAQGYGQNMGQQMSNMFGGQQGGLNTGAGHGMNAASAAQLPFAYGA